MKASRIQFFKRPNLSGQSRSKSYPMLNKVEIKHSNLKFKNKY